MPGDIAISGVRILLIDDDPEFLFPFERLSGTELISLTCAHDGQSGLDILDRRAFDLILLDMFPCPTSTGWTCCAASGGCSPRPWSCSGAQ